MQKVNNCISEQFLRRNVTRVNVTLNLKNVIKGMTVHHALMPNYATARHETNCSRKLDPFSTKSEGKRLGKGSAAMLL